MKTRTLLLILSLFVICACSKAPKEKGVGYLTLNINQSMSLKSGIEIEDFILRINDGNVDVLKERLGDLPAEIALTVGTYTIEAYSMEFSDPMFEMPFYAGSTVVEIEADENTEASLVCGQGNAGIKVVWSNEFLTLFETYYAKIECNEGYLHYSDDEERTGYFLPGTVTVSIMADGDSIYGGTITLAARDMVTATMHPKIKDDPFGGLTIKISIDDTVNNREVDIIFDPDYTGDLNSDNSVTNPYSIAEAIVRQGENAVWVVGYIVGAKPTTQSDFDFVNGPRQNGNIVLADDKAETNAKNVLFVELYYAATRNPLNLVTHQGNLHKKVLIKGNLRGYFVPSHAGLRDLTGEFFLMDE